MPENTLETKRKLSKNGDCHFLAAITELTRRSAEGVPSFLVPKFHLGTQLSPKLCFAKHLTYGENRGTDYGFRNKTAATAR